MAGKSRIDLGESLSQKKCPAVSPGSVSPIQDRKNSNDGSAAGDQVDDEHDQRGNQQQVNQAAGYMQAEPEEPQNQQNGKYGPEHRPSFLVLES